MKQANATSGQNHFIGKFLLATFYEFSFRYQSS